MSEVIATKQASSVGVWRVQETFVRDYTKRTAKRQAVRKWKLAWIRGPKASSLDLSFSLLPFASLLFSAIWNSNMMALIIKRKIYCSGGKGQLLRVQYWVLWLQKLKCWDLNLLTHISMVAYSTHVHFAHWYLLLSYQVNACLFVFTLCGLFFQLEYNCYTILC